MNVTDFQKALDKMVDEFGATQVQIVIVNENDDIGITGPTNASGPAKKRMKQFAQEKHLNFDARYQDTWHGYRYPAFIFSPYE